MDVPMHMYVLMPEAPQAHLPLLSACICGALETDDALAPPSN